MALPKLSAAGDAASRRRMARLVRSAAIAGVSRRRGPRTTRRASRESTQRLFCSTLAGMAMGTRRAAGSQQSTWVAAAGLPRDAGHPFYDLFNLKGVRQPGPTGAA